MPADYVNFALFYLSHHMTRPVLDGAKEHIQRVNVWQERFDSHQYEIPVGIQRPTPGSNLIALY